MDSGALRLQKTIVDCDHLVAHCIESVSEIAHDKNIDLIVDGLAKVKG